MTGPYNTPLALAREPWTAAFFAFCAPLLFPVIVISVAQFVLGPGQDLSASAIWIAVCIGVGLQFLVLSLWCEAIGAGPFAGKMQTNFAWVLIAIFAGPALLYGPMILVDMFMPADSAWVYRAGDDVDLSILSARTLSFMFYVLILAPVVEEITYRGVAMGAVLSRGLHPAFAAIVSSIAFTLPHVQYSNLALIALFVTGLGFAVLRLLSGTIIVPIAAHIAANSISVFNLAG